MVTVDMETYWSQTFSLSKISTEEYIRSPEFEVIGLCLKKDDGPIEWVTGDDEAIKSALLRYGCDKDACIAHNAAFDMAIMSWRYGVRPPVIVDTLSMARPITGISVGGSLRALSEYFGLGEKGTEVYNTKGKHRADFSKAELAAFGDYCKQDVNLTYQLYQRLKPLSTLQEMYLIDMTIRMFTEPVIELDTDLLEEHLAKVKADKAAVLSSVGECREVFMSNDKFAEKLRELGVEPPTKVSPTTGKETYAFAKTDDGFKALLEHPDERVQALASARLGVKSTIEETRTETFLAISKRGPMPIMLQYYGAVNTGRFSGGDGTNPQNLPRGGVLRASMKPPKGYKIIACDSSNVEARVLAWWAGQKDLVEAFANKKDVYSMFASTVYGKPINKHDNPNERHVGKTCVLGLGYSVGAARLQGALANGIIRIHMPLEECQRIVKVYRNSYPMITKSWRDCQAAIASMYEGYSGRIGVGCQIPFDGKTRTITLPNGMKLQYPQLTRTVSTDGRYEHTYKKKKFTNRLYGGALVENLVQAMARIIVSYQMCAIKQRLDATNAAKNDGKIRRVVHMVHDEVIVVAPEDEAEEVKRMMETVMSTAPAWAPGLPVACEAGVGDNYGEAK